jgi:hypothetical protein
VLGAIAQFEKATTVAKLKAARDRKIAAGEKCGGRKSYAEARPEMVELARQLRRPHPDRRPVSLRKVAAALAERGYVASTGRPYEAAAIASQICKSKMLLQISHRNLSWSPLPLDSCRLAITSLVIQQRGHWRSLPRIDTKLLRRSSAWFAI